MHRSLLLRFPPQSPAHWALEFLRQQEGPVHLVGGCVRDLLLSRPTKDLDVLVQADGARLARRLADHAGGAFVMLDAERDMGRAILTGSDGKPFEVDCASWRADNLAGDLQLRDFTINALAVPVAEGGVPVLDVTGGLEDLDRGLVRVTSSQALADDPLRGLRAVRLASELAAKGFRLEGETAHLARQHAPDLIICASERIRDEMVRILAASQPGRWLRLMSDLGQLAVVLPEVEALRGVAQSPPHHWDVWEHTLAVMDRAAWQDEWLAGTAVVTDPADQHLAESLQHSRPLLAAHFSHGESAARSRAMMLRWAALSHDWGKPASQSTVPPSNGGPARIQFLGHETISAELAALALRRLRFNDAEVRRVAKIVAGHMRPLHLAQSEVLTRRAVFRYYRSLEDAGVDVAWLSLADFRAAAGPEVDESAWLQLLVVVRRLLEDYFQRPRQAVRPQPIVDGRDLMQALSLPSGRLIGWLLDEIAEAQAAGEIETSQEALEYASQLLAEGPSFSVP